MAGPSPVTGRDGEVEVKKMLYVLLVLEGF